MLGALRHVGLLRRSCVMGVGCVARPPPLQPQQHQLSMGRATLALCASPQSAAASTSSSSSSSGESGVSQPPLPQQQTQKIYKLRAISKGARGGGGAQTSAPLHATGCCHCQPFAANTVHQLIAQTMWSFLLHGLEALGDRM